ncbi:MAG: hypothetical protein J2P27_16820 [Actinobacteria bacterium]|nr:hypothetical protein [Actinomycetota bacterium]
MPTTRWMKLARRLGRDGNPLRRRSDLIEAWLAPVAILVFLALCPLVVSLVAMGVRAENGATQRAQQSWHPVSAVLLRTAPGPEFADHGANTWTEWAPARWTVGGRRYTANIPVPARSPAGSRQTVWLDRAGHVMAPAMNARELGDAIDTSILLALSTLAVVVTVAVATARLVLDRRRLASWEAAWLHVGPRWSHQV